MHAGSLAENARRAVEVLRVQGETPGAKVDDAIDRLAALADAKLDDHIAKLDRAMSSHLFAVLEVDEKGVIRVGDVPDVLRLRQAGWTAHIAKILNPHGLRGDLFVIDAQGLVPLLSGSPAPDPGFPHDAEDISALVARSAFDVALVASEALTGAPVEYRVVSTFSRDAGASSVAPNFFLATPPDHPTVHPVMNAWRQTQADPTRTKLVLRTETSPSRNVLLDIRDSDGGSCTASVTVTDAQGRFYPARSMRLAPDMHFQSHVYRSTGEPITLPNGSYTIAAQRGPEYLETMTHVEVDDEVSSVSIGLTRWIDPADFGYYSSDPHIHASGCAHYSTPTGGVGPTTMIRHVRGEGLWVGSVLTWGPCYYHQKKNFTGKSISPPNELEHPELQHANGVHWEHTVTDTDHHSSLHYDLEVSGFPSSHSGHPVLLGLYDQDYPDANGLSDWPSWNLPVLQWAKGQGATVGFAHVGMGMSVDTDELPNYEIPAFSATGANEFIVDLAHSVVDFLSGGEIAPAAELNVWYHALNSGYRALMMGETDYPCMYDDRPGVARTYAKIDGPPTGEVALRKWLAGFLSGASYFGDGRSHIFDLHVNGEQTSELVLTDPKPLRVTAKVGALLPEDLPGTEPGRPPYRPTFAWHIERARSGATRDVEVELIFNGRAVDSASVTADGSVQEVEFDVEPPTSGWLALRIFPSAHSQPVFVDLRGAPNPERIASASWLHKCVDALWEVKSPFIRESEKGDAAHAYRIAKDTYARIAEFDEE